MIHERVSHSVMMAILVTTVKVVVVKTSGEGGRNGERWRVLNAVEMAAGGSNGGIGDEDGRKGERC